MDVLAASSPILVAILFIVISPLLVARVKRTVQAQIAADREKLGIPQGSPVQPPLTPAVIGDYIDYAADAIQIFPVTLLPIIGAVFAVSKHAVSMWAVALICFVFVVALALEVYVLVMSTSDYVSRRFLRLSVVAWVALISNIIGLVIVLITGFVAR